MRTIKKVNCVLLVDDHHPMNFLNQIIIEEEDFADTIKCAQSGRATVEYLNSSDKAACPIPNIIFMDINMPGMNGWELFERIRGKAELQDTLFFILTASNAPQDTEKANAIEGINGIFEKPLSQEILQKISQVCSFKMTRRNQLRLSMSA